MKVSILLPTRGRCEDVNNSPLVTSVLSIVDTAHSTDNYEILFRFDYDDYNSISNFTKYLQDERFSNLNYRILIGERFGYVNLLKHQLAYQEPGRDVVQRHL